MKNLLLFSVFTMLLLSACQPQERSQELGYSTQKTAIGNEAAAVTPHPLSSQVAMDILKQGGNAVDAAIAVQFAMAVVYPRAGNLGGGGFMVVRTADGSADALDYREKAPMAAHRDMYLDSTGQVIEGRSRNGVFAVGVPGTVAGMQAAFDKYSKLKDWGTLLRPAIEYAEKGYHISPTEAERLMRFQGDFRAHNEAPNPFIQDTFYTGYLLQQPSLAKTLKRIQQEGAAGFYEGATATAVVQEMKERGGLIQAQDLSAYEAVWRKPIETGYRDYRIISMPPSSSGGVALGQMLNMVEPYSLFEESFHSPQSVHLMVEAERRAFADRAQYLGDSDFYEVPIDSLLSPAYLKKRMADFQLDQATESEMVTAGDFQLRKESFETTHTSIVDADGMAVSVTTTLNSNFGSKVWVKDAGFFLNNEMDDFSAKPGVPNQFGLLGSEANAIAPEKRMLSSMTPTIIEKNGELFMVLGAPGGSTIITAVFQVFVNVADFGLTLEEAVNAGRFHHQWLPDEILIEKGALPDSTMEALSAMGHTFREIERMAVIKAILRDKDGTLQAVGDPRNPDDDARAY
jgi:gamma-glutamyltranspeptidase/glutathione hydrolase